MSETAPSTVYDELLHAFKDAVIYALGTGRLSPICADFDVALIYAIGEVARAARHGGCPDSLVREACAAFGQYAIRECGFEDDPPALKNVGERAAREAPERSGTA